MMNKEITIRFENKKDDWGRGYLEIYANCGECGSVNQLSEPVRIQDIREALERISTNFDKYD